jgi:hypothetical protein
MASTEDNPYASPPPPAECGDAQTRRPAYRMSPAPLEGGDGDHPNPPVWGLGLLRANTSLAAGLAFLYVGVFALYPTLGAAIATIVFSIGLGLLTTKVVLRIDDPRKVWCLTPLCGLGEVAVLWLLFRLAALFR